MEPDEYRPPSPLTGSERFHAAGNVRGFDLCDFWRWSSSDLVGNALRGKLAEFLVARALDLTATSRVEWDACDLRGPDGNVEVKSAAYLQSWKQARPSMIKFGIQPSFSWDPVTNAYPAERRRPSDVYVFCLLHHADRNTLDPLDLDQWTFYVLSTRILDDRVPHQKTISLSTLRALGPTECGYDGLADAVRTVAGRPR